MYGVLSDLFEGAHSRNLEGGGRTEGLLYSLHGIWVVTPLMGRGVVTLEGLGVL